jgi:NACHT domain
MEGTRVEILEEIRVWARMKASGTRIYCIGDVAGTGKSTIAKTLAKEWYNDGILVAMFFFSQESTSVGTASDFCFSIADQIEEFDRSPDLKAYWESIFAGRKNLASRDFDEQWSKLVLRPLSMLSQRGNLLLVVDAPDECTASTRIPLLECLLKACSSESLLHIRVLLTTRNEPDLLKLLRHNAFSNIILHKSLRNSTNSNADVAFYVNQRLDQNEIFTSSPEQRLLLVDRCDGLFIFAFLACNLLEDACSDDRPLEDILHEFTSLDALYHRTLSRADRSPKFTREPLRMILGIIIVAQEPLSISAIKDLLVPSVGSMDVAALVGRLGTILASGGIEEPLYILHATFTEFLLRQNWVTTSGRKAINEYAVSRAQSNRLMARGCFSILLKDLSGELMYAPHYY